MLLVSQLTLDRSSTTKFACCSQFNKFKAASIGDARSIKRHLALASFVVDYALIRYAD